MTTIEITPLHNALFSRARVTAKPVRGSFGDLLAWNFDQFTAPFITLKPPPAGDAWVIGLTIGAITTLRTVTFVGTVVTWDGLTDVDPSTLEPVPEGPTLAAWIAVRDEIMAAIELPDLTTLFENRIS